MVTVVEVLIRNNGGIHVYGIRYLTGLDHDQCGQVYKKKKNMWVVSLLNVHLIPFRLLC